MLLSKGCCVAKPQLATTTRHASPGQTAVDMKKGAYILAHGSCADVTKWPIARRLGPLYLGGERTEPVWGHVHVFVPFASMAGHPVQCWNCTCQAPYAWSFPVAASALPAAFQSEAWWMWCTATVSVTWVHCMQLSPQIHMKHRNSRLAATPQIYREKKVKSWQLDLRRQFYYRITK